MIGDKLVGMSAHEAADGVQLAQVRRQRSVDGSRKKTSSLRVLLTLLAVLIAFNGEVRAQQMMGSGLTKCSEYGGAVAAQADGLRSGIELWVLGYVSALNMIWYVQQKQDLLLRESYQDVIGFVRGYCASNSQKTIANAANEYWFQLAGRARR